MLGEERWHNDRTLIFSPTVALQASTNYTDKISEQLKSIGGSTLPKQHQFEFSTEQIKTESSLLGNDERAIAMQQIKLKFNQVVDGESIKKHCGSESESGRLASKFGSEQSEAQGKIFVVLPDGKLSLDTAWRLKCKSALHGGVGNIGIADGSKKEIRTYGPLKYINHDPSGRDIVPTEGQRIGRNRDVY